MTDEEVGQYIRILCQQYDKGHLSPLLVKSICKTSDVPQNIAHKLLLDEQGLLYNERADREKEKRIKFSNSRKMNAHASALHMENENEYDLYLNNIQLTKKEFGRLVDEFGQIITDKAIKYLSDYKIEKGYKTKDDNRTIRRWVIDAIKEREIKHGNKHGNNAGGFGIPKEYEPEPKPTTDQIERNKKRLKTLTESIASGANTIKT
jgi:hypothetical protein